MRILLSNDDGIEAPGLDGLVAAARRLTDDVWVVAPDGNRSSAGHAITLGRPLTLTRLADRRFTCSGTPADCVITALAWLIPGDARPDLVLSGINDGLNVAEDVAYSGTMAVAREASFWGIPAVSLSGPKGLGRYDERGLDWLAGLLHRFWRTRPAWATEGHWLNLNLPAAVPAPLRAARIGRDKVGRVVTVLSRDGSRTVLETVRSRPGTAGDGDENALTCAGFACLTNLNWFGSSPVPAEVLEGTD